MKSMGAAALALAGAAAAGPACASSAMGNRKEADTANASTGVKEIARIFLIAKYTSNSRILRPKPK